MYGRRENAGLEIVIELLNPIKKHFDDVSWADLFIVAGAVAVKTLGGPDIPVTLGRLDIDAVPMPGVMDLESFDIKRLKARFLRMGLSVQDWLRCRVRTRLGTTAACRSRMIGTSSTTRIFGCCCRAATSPKHAAYR